VYEPTLPTSRIHEPRSRNNAAEIVNVRSAGSLAWAMRRAGTELVLWPERQRASVEKCALMLVGAGPTRCAANDRGASCRRPRGRVG
jgi:hypothetical protein